MILTTFLCLDNQVVGHPHDMENTMDGNLGPSHITNHDLRHQHAVNQQLQQMQKAVIGNISSVLTLAWSRKSYKTTFLHPESILLDDS